MKNLITTTLLLIMLSSTASYCFADMPDEILEKVTKRLKATYDDPKIMAYRLSQELNAYEFVQKNKMINLNEIEFLQIKKEISKSHPNEFLMQTLILALTDIRKHVNFVMGQ